MIKSAVITEIEAKKHGKRTNKYNVYFNLKKVEFEKKEIKVEYEYLVKYTKEAYIKITGEIIDEENEEEIKKIKNEFETKKKLPDKYMERFINTINFIGTVAATNISSVIHLFPPVRVPKLEVKSK